MPKCNTESHPILDANSEFMDAVTKQLEMTFFGWGELEAGLG